MSTVRLTGLRADLPIAVMAAFGVLRISARTPDLAAVKLRWEQGAGGEHAVLELPGHLDDRDLLDVLIQDVRSAPTREELTWSDQIKTVTRDEFRERSRQALENGDGLAAWFTAFGTELHLDREEKAIEPTPFDMSVARQRFLLDARKLASGLAKGSGVAYREALFGPWRYADDQHSLGWDPGTIKLGAFTHRAPTGMANSGVRAAVWLAFESLPLFPCFYSGGFAVTAFRRTRRDFTLCWPVWRPSITLSGLRILLAWEGLVRTDPPLDEMKARGITAIYRSQKFKPNKYLSSFRAAELAAAAE